MILEPSSALKYARAHCHRFVEELKEFVRFPTVSAQPRHSSDMKACAQWLAEHLGRIGLDIVEVVPTQRHPVVYAACRSSAGKPSVLIYGHYDVQPADPVREWHSPPFEPTIRDGNLFGRGVSDDKGQVFAHLKALESYLKTDDELPVGITCLIDGEEEIGSPNLPSFLRRNARRLASDIAVVSDMAIRGPGKPAITYAMRGNLNLELSVRGPLHDLHSGTFGGAIHNPLQVLCEIVSKMHDSSGRVAIPGFYDRVRRASGGERAHLGRVGPTDSQILRNAGSEDGWGEPGYTLFERITLRPALTVNGLSGGYQGPGSKGIIPAIAKAKLSIRLVPDQNPIEIGRIFRSYVSQITPPTVRVKVRIVSGAKPIIIASKHAAVHAARFAYRKGFGAEAVLIRNGGTIPVTSVLREVLKTPVVLMGFALPDDRMHAPNEKFHLQNFHSAVATAIWFLAAITSRRFSQRRGNKVEVAAFAM
jgi:acetylornithine deacetylase/succinyl-diaminopimelate desuccinylase-like protein